MKKIITFLVIMSLGVSGAVSCKSRVEPEATDSKKETVTAGQTSAKEQVRAEPDAPYYYDREIATDDIAQYNLRELSLVRNTIFARAGHVFTKQWLSDYFTSQPWYTPSGFDETKLSDFDRHNAEVVARREANMPRGELLKRLDALNEMRKKGLWNDDYNIELGLISHALGETVAWDPSRELRSPLEDPKLLDKLITVKQISDLSRRDLRILRNMIFARHGRPFVSVILQEYFNRMSWYEIDPDYSDDMLTDIDQKNIRIILSVEESLGGPLTEAQHAGKEATEEEETGQEQAEASDQWMSGA